MLNLEAKIKQEREYGQKIFDENPYAFNNIYLKLYEKNFDIYVEQINDITFYNYNELIYKTLKSTNQQYKAMFEFKLK